MGIMKLLTVAVHSCFLCQRSNFFSSILWVPVFVYPKKSPSSNSEKSVLNHTVRVWRNVDETLTGHVWLAGEELGGRPWRPLANLVIMWRFGPQTELDEVDVFSLSPVVAWDLRTCDGDNEDAENDEDDEHDEDSMKMIIMISWLGLFWWCWIWFLQGSNNISLHPFVCAIEECKALPVQMNRPGSSNIWLHVLESWEYSEWPPNVLTWYLRWFAARLRSRTMMNEDNIQCSWRHTVHNAASFLVPFLGGKILIIYLIISDLVGVVRNWSFTNYEFVMIVADHSFILRYTKYQTKPI